MAAFQTAILSYFKNPQNFYNASPNAVNMWDAFAQFGGTITVDQIKNELSKVQLGDRQQLVAYINKYGVKAYLQAMENGLIALAKSDAIHTPNTAQRVFFGACLLVGGVLLFPEFAGVAAAVAIGEGLVVAGGIGTMTLDLYGE